MKGKLLVKVVTMEKSCEEAAEEERVLVCWWVASVEFKLEASALDERGAVAGGDLPVTGSMSLQPDTEQLGKIRNTCLHFWAQIWLAPIFFSHRLQSRNEAFQKDQKRRRCSPNSECLPASELLPHLQTSQVVQHFKPWPTKEREDRFTWRHSRPWQQPRCQRNELESWEIEFCSMALYHHFSHR